jgi:hypothetical protein
MTLQAQIILLAAAVILNTAAILTLAHSIAQQPYERHTAFFTVPEDDK